jgi:hypothetical protein
MWAENGGGLLLVKPSSYSFNKLIYLTTSFPTMSSRDSIGPRPFSPNFKGPNRPHSCGNLSFYLPENPLLGPNRATAIWPHMHEPTTLTRELNCIRLLDYKLHHHHQPLQIRPFDLFQFGNASETMKHYRHLVGLLGRIINFKYLNTVNVRLSGNSSIGKVALAAYFHAAHYNSPMALAAYFCRYPASRGIYRAVPKVSAPSESAPRTPEGQ